MPAPNPSAIDRISASMSIATLRNQVIASNIANRDAQDYQRLAVRFARTLDDSPVAVVAPDASPAAGSVEQDLVELSTNASRYQAMARVLSRYFSLIDTITGNRGA